MGSGSRKGLILAGVCALWGGVAAAACTEDRVTLRGDWGQAAFQVSVADEPGERSQGLMFVPSMPRFTGMLFVYGHEQRVAFWMKNTLIPLDMIFADGEGVVQKVHVNAIPGDLTTIPGGNNIQYVLEINGGLSDVLGISKGTELQHPAIEDAAWSC